jgi:hypothetical protein
MFVQKKLAIVPARAIDPDLKAFIDTCIVPLLVRDALLEMSRKDSSASNLAMVVESAPATRCASEEQA